MAKAKDSQSGKSSASGRSEEKPIDAVTAREAFQRLDELLKKTLTLYMGGGTSMVMAHGYPLATSDVDALPKQASFEEIDDLVKQVARELTLPADWLNPYFSSFTHVLPPDFASRVVRVFDGKFLKVDALGREDMLIMKCFAHRPKDLGHARALLKLGVQMNIVDAAIEACRARGVPGVEKAIEFLNAVAKGARGRRGLSVRDESPCSDGCSVKGLKRLPRNLELNSAYTELESSGPPEREERRAGRERDPLAIPKLALYSQWARLDARLAEVLTGYLLWKGANLEIGNLLRELSNQPWPRAILVPLRFVELAAASDFQRIAVRAVIESIEEAFPAKSNDLFFIPLQRMNRVVLNEAIGLCSSPYVRSGFLGSASLLAKGRQPEGATTLGAPIRKRILESFLSRLSLGESFSVEDYLAECNGQVTRRQAQRDLEQSKRLRPKGHTRGRRYERAV